MKKYLAFLVLGFSNYVLAYLNRSEPLPDFILCQTPEVHFKKINLKICRNLDTGKHNFKVGLCWAANEMPDIFDSFEFFPESLETFVFEVKNLKPSTNYTVRFFRLYDDGKVIYQLAHEIQTTKELSLGMEYQGGIIIHFFKSGEEGFREFEQHGLILSKENLGLAAWGGFGEAIMDRTSSSIGSGDTNTKKIIKQLVTSRALLSADSNFTNYIHPSAAQICADYENEGYSDWFLPSREEWICLFSNFDLIKLSSFIFDKTYWTSSEVYFSWSRKKRKALETKSQLKKSWAVSMPSHNLIVSSSLKKNQVAMVRAMRYF